MDQLNVDSEKAAMAEEKMPKLRYPKSVFFIISNEFCERFSYYGMRTVLALYLQSLRYSEDESTMIYHFFVMLCYFTPLIGGIMADAWLGKYKTILYISIVYAIGNIVLSFGSVTVLNIPHVALSMLGLILIGAGTGGIKPCVSSFGGDQFKLPEQKNQLKRFFSIFYFSVNTGSVISCFLTPILRENVSCLGQDTCYPLAFGIPAILMILSIVIFVCGKPLYKIQKPEGNIAVDVVKCIGHAVVRKVKVKKLEKNNHWLDYASDKYSKKLIDDTKVLIKLVVLFLPTIVFWALYEQQGSRWTFQANQMDGNFHGYIVEPDQMQTVNAVLCIAFIPIFETVIYPILEKIRLVRTPLQKLSYGGLLAGLAFLVSGFLQLKIEALDPVLPTSGHADLRIYNNFDCDLYANSSGFHGKIDPLGFMDFKGVNVGNPDIDFIVQGCKNVNISQNAKVELKSELISSYLVSGNSTSLELILLNLNIDEEITRSDDASAKIKAIYSGSEDIKVDLNPKSAVNPHTLTVSSHKSETLQIKNNIYYTVTTSNNKATKDIYVRSGGVYTLIITENNIQLLTVTDPNSVNLMWQLPQYFIITFAEIMFSITGIEFSYSESPDSMKSVLSSIWLLTDSFGNILVIVIANLKMFDSKAYEFFLYAVMMTVVMAIFIIQAYFYKYENYNKADEKEKETETETTPI